MNHLIRLLHLEKIKELFIENDVDDVLKWIEAIDHRRPVVFVGSGFSRNAENPNGANIPMWDDMLKLFNGSLQKSDKGVPHFDPLHLAELYYERMGEAIFSKNILKLFPDSEVQPGKAHKALYEYDSEAIITTNNLDTLLDRGNRFVKVVEDTDLIRSKQGFERDVIYIHGHRDRPSSWAITRSQYEDIPRKKPGLLTKVRQLVIQHPFLFLGYSLVDPDFHLVYREVWRILQNNNYPGLAIFLNEPDPNEKAHWQKLGVSLVTLRKDVEAQEAFVKFLKIQPDLKRNKLDLVVAKNHLKDESAEKFLSKIDTLNSVENHVYPFKSTELSELWWYFAEHFLGKEKLRYLEHFTAMDHNKTQDDKIKEYYLGRTWRFEEKYKSRYLIRVINELLENDSIKTISVWDWLFIGLKGEVEFDHLVVDPQEIALGLIALEPKMKKFADTNTFREGVSHILKISTIYMDSELKELAFKIGEKYKINPHASFQGKAKSNQSFPKYMKQGFLSALNGEYFEARKNYLLAVEVARKSTDRRGEYLAIRSAQNCFTYEDRDDVTLHLVTDLKKRKEIIEQDSFVQEMVNEEKNAIKKSQRENYERLKGQLNYLQFGSENVRYNNIYHKNYIIVKKFEAFHVHPQIIKDILEPLVEGNVLSFKELLSYRFKYGYKTNKEFSSKIRKVDDLSLKELYSETSLTVSELYNRLETFPYLFENVERGHLDVYLQFLNRCHQKIGTSLKSFSHHHIIHQEYALAWRCLISLMDIDEARNELTNVCEKLKERDLVEFGRQLDNLPWREWLEKDAKISRTLKIPIFFVKKFSQASSLNILSIAIDTNKLSTSDIDQISEVVKSIYESILTSKDHYAKSEYIRLACKLKNPDFKKLKSLLIPFIDVEHIANETGIKKMDQFRKIESSLYVLGKVISYTGSKLVSRKEIQKFNSILLKVDTEYWKHIKRNNHLAYGRILYGYHHTEMQKKMSGRFFVMILEYVPSYIPEYLYLSRKNFNETKLLENHLMNLIGKTDYSSIESFLLCLDAILYYKISSCFDLIKQFLYYPAIHY
jgi:SIR2-like domain